MQRDPRFFTGKATRSRGYTHDAAVDGNYTYGTPDEPGFDAALAGTKHGYPGPLNDVQFQPSETCPRNFIIFDQTDDKSRIMYNPALARKFSYPGVDVAHAQGSGSNRGKDYQDKSSSLKEDSEDIDALLSLEEEEEEDDVVSTGRTPCNYGGSSPDSLYSTEASKSSKMRFSSTQISTSGSTSGRKKEKMRKMVKALRGIVPGGNQMDTPAVLDEAVRYLKSLKMEVKKLGIQDFKD